MEKKEPLRIRKAVRTRATIVATAYSLFLRQGFEATTLEQIADLSDIHKQTVLRYFNTKEDIALDARMQLADKFVSGLSDPNRAISTMEYWREYVKQVSKTISDRGDYFGSDEFINTDPRLVARTLALEGRYEAALARAFAQEAGRDPQGDIFSTIVATYLVSVGRNVAMLLLANKDIAPSRLLSKLLAVTDLAQYFDRTTIEELLDRTNDLEELPRIVGRSRRVRK